MHKLAARKKVSVLGKSLVFGHPMGTVSRLHRRLVFTRRPSIRRAKMKDRFFDEPSLGIGIKLIGQIADELSYTHTYERRNCLSIVKFFQPILPQNKLQLVGLKPSSDVLSIFNWLKEQIQQFPGLWCTVARVCPPFW
ncbi:hypothetical protein [Microcoleus sp. Pol12B4]|uniref:hypothetical protein n=1 Tax=Microcoleus sp. Pol12B4 TaxID=3055395 RepID=UPI002FD1DEE9